ncbi:MAG: hypothetical protein NZM00_04550 [Anaerolinea sp.]|nr:hypothetical protein [Anaerolinea sp.]
MTTTQEQANNNLYLMQALNYYEQDLAHNRAGRLSPRQIELLRIVDRRKRRAVLYGLAVIVVVLIASALLVLASPQFRIWLESVLKTEVGRIGLSIPALIFGVAVIWMLWLLIRRPWSQQNITVRSVEGPARVRDMTFPPNSTANLIAQCITGDVASFQVKIGRHIFFVAPLVARGFVNDQPYRVHYAQLSRGKHGRWLIAAERL